MLRGGGKDCGDVSRPTSQKVKVKDKVKVSVKEQDKDGEETLLRRQPPEPWVFCRYVSY